MSVSASLGLSAALLGARGREMVMALLIVTFTATPPVREVMTIAR